MKAIANRHCSATALLHVALIAVVFLCVQGTLRADSMLTAEQLMRAGKFAEATILLTPLTIREPSNFRAHVLLGEAYYRQGNLPKASSSLKRAYELRPNNAQATGLLGLVRYAQGDNAIALKHLKSAVALGDNSADTAYHLGLAYRRVGDIIKARDTLSHSALRNPDHLPTVTALAQVEKALGHHAEAAYWFRKALSKRPDDVALFHDAADSALAAGDFLGAEMLLKAHLQKHNRDSDAWRKLAACYMQLGLSIEARKVYLQLDQLGALKDSERKSLIAGYLSQAMWHDAIAHYGKLRSPSDDPQLHAAIAQAYARTGQLEAGLKAARTTTKLSPKPVYRELLATMLTAAGKHGEAYEIYAELVGELPTPELLTAAAEAALRCGKAEQAIALLKRVVATSPNDVQLRSLLAQTCEKFGDIREALAQWTVAVEMDGKSNAPRIALARLAMVAGHRAWAITQLRQLNIAKTAPDELLIVARLSMALGDVNTGVEAAQALLNAADVPQSHTTIAAEILIQAGHKLPEERLAKIFEADQTNPLACRIYAQSLIHTGRGEAALSACRKALAAAPETAEMYAIVLDVCAALNIPQTAPDMITVAIGFEGENAVAMDFLRLAYESAYDVQRAADEMLALARAKPSGPRIASAARACEKAGRWFIAAELHESTIPERGSFAIRDTALAYIEAGNYEQAKTLLFAALASSSNWKELPSLLADMPVEPQVLRTIANIFNDAPDQSAFSISVAKLLVDLDMVQNGLVFFNARKSADAKIAATSGRAYLMAHSGRELAACAELERLNSTDLASPETHLALAECYLLAGNDTAAKTAVLNVRGTSTDIHARRLIIVGQAAMRGSNPSDALESFAAALLSQPDNKDAIDGILALCQAQAIDAASVRHRLTHIYKHSNEPKLVIALAQNIAELPEYGEMAEWASARADKNQAVAASAGKPAATPVIADTDTSTPLNGYDAQQ